MILNPGLPLSGRIICTHTLHPTTVHVQDTKVVLMGSSHITYQFHPRQVSLLYKSPFYPQLALGINNCRRSIWISWAHLHRRWVCSQWWVIPSRERCSCLDIEGHTNQNRLIGKCVSPSDADKHSSFWSKLASIYATVFTMYMLLPPTTEKPMVRMVCDGKLVLMRLWQTHIMDPAKPHDNLISAARYLIQHSRVKVNLFHVKGHQDAQSFGPFTQDATMNIKANQLAKEKLEAYWPGPTIFHIPWSQGVCYMDTQRLKKPLPTTSGTTSMANGLPNIG